MTALSWDNRLRGWGILLRQLADQDWCQLVLFKNQEEHHRNKTFREEYIALLEEHGVVYDEKYLLLLTPSGVGGG